MSERDIIATFQLLRLPSFKSGHQFDVNDAILNSLKNLEVTLAVNSSVKIDDCVFFLPRGGAFADMFSRSNGSKSDVFAQSPDVGEDLCFGQLREFVRRICSGCRLRIKKVDA